MTIQTNYQQLKEHVRELAIQYGRNPDEITIVAATKNQPSECVEELFGAGCRDFGESKIQEALTKQEQFPHKVRWHLIGSLQKNKVRKVIGRFDLIHSVDSFALAEKISTCSEEAGGETSILLQANTSGELSKHGLSPIEWKECYEQLIRLKNLRICGLMTMAPLTNDERIVRRCFEGLRELRDELSKLCGSRMDLKHLSMGMSHDYPQAIAEGATILRIGSKIFE